MSYPKLEIPDEDRVFYRVHQKSLVEGRLTYSAIKPIGDALSVDWAHFSTAEESRARGSNELDNGIIAAAAGVIRSTLIPTENPPSTNFFRLEHDPQVEDLERGIKDNQSHSGVYGIFDPPKSLRKTAKKLLREVFEWELKLLVCSEVHRVVIKNFTGRINSFKGGAKFICDRECSAFNKVIDNLDENTTMLVIYRTIKMVEGEKRKERKMTVIRGGEPDFQVGNILTIINAYGSPQDGLTLNSIPSAVQDNWEVDLEEEDLTLVFHKIKEAPFKWIEPTKDVYNMTE